jgi:hypothetical protein
MTWQDDVGVIFGVILIAIGLAYFLSPRFADLAFAWTTQGLIWKKRVGERWAPRVAKYVFSLVSIAFGLWVLYVSIWKPS